MLRLCAFTILLVTATAAPRRSKIRTTPTPTVEHKNEDFSNERLPEDLGWFEDFIRRYPEDVHNKAQGTHLPASNIQPAIEQPPALLDGYEAQDFVEDGFGIQIQDNNTPAKSGGEYPGLATGNTDTKSHIDPHPETTVSKEEASDIHSDAQKWFDSLDKTKTSDTKSHIDQHPEATVSKEASDIHSDVQKWFDSLDENIDKYNTQNIASYRGIPGVNFPDYEDIPLSSFTCFDKQYLPGFYADMDTGCQVFHMCYDNRKVSYLCPVGTVFNQAVLTCDHWQNSNCSRTPLHYNSNIGIGYPPHQEKHPHDDTNKNNQENSNHPSYNPHHDKHPHEDTNNPHHDQHPQQKEPSNHPSYNPHHDKYPPHEDANNPYHDQHPQQKEPSNHPSAVVTSEETVPQTQVYTPATNSEDYQPKDTNRGTVPSEYNQGSRPSRKPGRPQQHDHEFSALRYLDLFLKYFPIKAKVTMFPENGQTKVKAITSIGNSMRQRITVYPVANNSRIVAEASIGQKRRQNRPRPGGYSAVTSAPAIQNQKKGRGIDQDVFDDIDDSFDIVRRVLDHVGKLLQRTTTVTGNDRRSTCRCRTGSHSYNSQPGHPQRCRCYQPLPQLNPRFRVQPVVI